MTYFVHDSHDRFTGIKCEVKELLLSFLQILSYIPGI